MCVGMSDSFSVSNGVRQGSVLSPVLFAVYLDGLLSELEGSGVGCYWGAHFVGAVCYADDIALLAPCPSAMRTMFSVCEEYAVTHGLKFNPDKTQLIRFRLQSTCMYHDRISLDGVDLKFSDTVMHLGHLLSYNLDDTPYLMTGYRDQNSFSGIIPVKPGWMVGMHNYGNFVQILSVELTVMMVSFLLYCTLTVCVLHTCIR